MRKLLLILLVLAPFCTLAQSPMFKLIAKKQSGCSLLLDSYGGASVAYSVRKLKCAYAGACLRIRESGGNTESDIGFDVNGNLDTTALLSFVGANDGFVTVWYDQSGNSNNAFVATAAWQPQLVSAGVINRRFDLPAIFWDGSNDFLEITTPISAVSPWSSFIVQKKETYNKVGLLLGQNVVNLPMSPLIFNDGNTYIGDNTGIFHYGAFNTPHYGLVTGFTTATSTNQIYFNRSNVNLTTTGTLGGHTDFNLIGARFGGLQSEAYCNEIIYYNSDKTSDRVGIEGNILAYHIPSWMDLEYASGLVIESALYEWSAVSPLAWNSYTLSNANLPADGAYINQFMNSSTVNAMIGFNTSNTSEPYSGYEAWIQVAASGLVFWGENSSSGSTGVTISVGDYVGMFRSGSTVVIKTSSDKITWTPIYTYSFTSSATLYLNMAVYDDGSTTGKMYRPQLLIQ